MLTIHPALWRATQVARGVGAHGARRQKVPIIGLPGGDWPIGTLVEMLAQRPGIGELSLLRPALLASATRPIARAALCGEAA